MLHPSLGVFLDWLQRYQYKVQCRGIQLLAGRTWKQKSTVYAKVDDGLSSAKVDYSLVVDQIFCSLFPHPGAWVQFSEATEKYLSQVCHLHGDDWSKSCDVDCRSVCTQTDGS